jgi:hypothetical protein
MEIYSRSTTVDFWCVRVMVRIGGRFVCFFLLDVTDFWMKRYMVDYMYTMCERTTG